MSLRSSDDTGQYFPCLCAENAAELAKLREQQKHVSEYKFGVEVRVVPYGTGWRVEEYNVNTVRGGWHATSGVLPLDEAIAHAKALEKKKQ